jgi:hypothetical protein
VTRRFRRFACLDWSGAVGPWQAGIALAVCETGDAAPVLVPPPDRRWSRSAVMAWLAAHADADMLVGIDFSASFPFMDRRAFFPGWVDSPVDARALWALVERLSADDPHLAVSGFIDHGEASRHFRRHGGREGDLFGGGAGRFRVTERAARAMRLMPQSSLNLVGAAQVGKASLAGMRMLHRLGDRIPVWPFDPVPARGALIVEIYTSLAARAAGVTGGTKMRDGPRLDAALAALGSRPHVPLARYDDHSTDALLTAAWLRRASGDGPLWRPAGLDAVRDTEGWTFGVS